MAAGPLPVTPSDLGPALRAVWEVRRAEERLAYCMGAWQSIVFGLMGASIFALYGLAAWLDLQGPLVTWLWLPPVLLCYTALAFINKTMLGLPRPALPWSEVAVGTGLFAALMALLTVALWNRVLTDVAAGMSLVVGTFHILLGAVFLRQSAPTLFGVAVVTGAAAIVLLDPWPWLSFWYGILFTSGGMVAMGASMLRRPFRASPGHGVPGAQGGDGDDDLAQVRETLVRLRGHEARVQARERAAQAFLVAAVLALAGVISMVERPGIASALLLATAGAAVLVGLWRRRVPASSRAEADEEVGRDAA